MSTDLFSVANTLVSVGVDNPKLSILSMGLGQDSMTIMFKIVHDADFKAKYAPNDLLVLFADTGNENDFTYAYRDNVLIPFCKKHEIEFVSITNDMGYHGNTWMSLTHQWNNGHPTIGSVAYPKTCTHNLKLLPQYRYLENWLFENYECVTKKKRKQGYVQFAQTHGRINWIVGIASGEENRVFDAEKETALWKKQAIHVIYPLISEGMDRQKCQDYIGGLGYEIPFPSSCIFCPFASKLEILYLFRAYPDRFNEWVMLEQNKLDAHQSAVRNLGVSGRLHKDGHKKGEAVTLLDVLKEAMKKHPHITLNELAEHRFSHGHCVVSKY
ncbi:MAG: Adenine nucleotide-binding protein [uncultured Sulfurovum sp.]|uniref:Adenine nucleotide-binding protein n=1 Tax=uncultured Sulfurovum sp. TaxID=269237 RepID=A0A6S6SJ98_9BACT|nr:MAG: Adenine nucleotide-binding protein [uncultured Sulfurovum sp.]